MNELTPPFLKVQLSGLATVLLLGTLSLGCNESEKKSRSKSRPAKTAVKEKSTPSKTVCHELIERLCDEVEEPTCERVRAQMGGLPESQCYGMMDKFPNILEDLRRQEAATRPLNVQKQTTIAEGDVPAFGNPDAAVTLVEFSDFECPYCSKAAKVAKQIKQKYKDKVHFVFRQFPLSFHKKAHLAAQASLAAHAQGKFWEYHDLLFENQRALSRPDLVKYAEQLGLNLGQFVTALNTQMFKSAVDRDLKIGAKVQVSGTPTLFLNGERVENPSDFQLISAKIDRLLN